MRVRQPSGEWIPNEVVQTLDPTFRVEWRPRDPAAPCYVVYRSHSSFWFNHYLIARDIEGGIELLKCSSKTQALRTARDLNRDPNGRVRAVVLKALRFHGYAPGDVAMYDNGFWRVIGGGRGQATCQFLFALDGRERGRTRTVRIKWRNLERFTLEQLGRLYLDLGQFIRDEAGRHGHSDERA